MPSVVKAALRALEYLPWAKSIERDARYDLTGSGMSDTVAPWSDDDEAKALADTWAGTLEISELCRRDVRRRAREEFIEVVAARYGVEPARVTPTLGSSLAITHVLMALLRPGDQVVVERPTYEPLHRVPEMLGASVSRLERDAADGWAVRPDRLARLLTSRTRAVILSNLHNPSGVGTSRETLLEVTELAARVGAVVLVDEVYLDYCFSTDAAGSLLPACLVAPNCISWSSTTKCFGFPALRAGWIVTGVPEAARAIRAATDYLHVDEPVSTLLLGARVLRQADRLTAWAERIGDAGREVVQRWITGEPRVSWVPPRAGLSGCIRLPDLMQDVPFAQHLRERYDTQVVPGSFFEAPGFVRLSFGVDPAILEQGLANVSAALDDLA
ncbi:aminotransferase class I/II-fold pyridoxal phosphate-dependent enzyme [Paraliomyxa miuraensis]|uniref:aminotransferase class I/II-fold pyridoxal phosphate-dependent enzyme n=1 Tax=Paraliomyxa miuraensis TaxID=376150 RepID=UPI0022599DF0|nr:aminotransferase class I/II-fold pyridoxal phosphate-dependent enzyme [Paraliomyxa miuraensis]MCX4243783.1 aminotransferase class I/II-fold pyridoxal phosphate-dependent enzyme [Paraliomyxa miuraensis]